jgi:glutamine synthetase
MNDSTAASDTSELARYLDENPQTRFVDAIFVDLCGVVRGKRYPREDIAKLYASGLQIPMTVYLLDVGGTSSDPCGHGFSDGDPDGVCFPVPGTLVPVPWLDQPAAQVLMTMNNPDGTPSLAEPRNIARHVLRRFEALNLYPVLAFELEFYLLDKERAKDGSPRLPRSPVSGRRADTTQVYGIAELDDFSAFFDDVDSACRIQKIPATVATSEFAPGQYEINLRHVDSPLAAADHCALLRNVIKCVARRHDLEATFISKPFVDSTGNGMHVHFSLLDDSGRNVFDDGSALGSDTLRYAIGGMQATMHEAMAIWAPNINAYRRFGPNLYVPVTTHWAANNRSVAFRIPVGPTEARRIEHRIAGADANPYLVLAALLAGVHHGLEQRIDPGPPFMGNATAEVDPDLPLDWVSALDRMQASHLLRDYLTDDYVDVYCATKRGELRALNQFVSAREYAWYL